MVYGDSTIVTALLGNVPTSIISSAIITEAITFGDSFVNMMTQHTWSSSDLAYNLIQQASSEWAAAHCLRMFEGDKWQKKADALEAHARKIIEEQVLPYDQNTSPDSQSQYNTWPGNPTATPYRSPGFAGSSSADPNTSP
jgi:hypothetical protein